MRSRFLVHVLVATVSIGGIAVAADALVETDREQLEQLAGDLVETRAGARTDAVLRWIDVSREEVAIARGRSIARFGEDNEHRLADALASALAPFEADDLELVQKSVSVDGDRGTVAVRVRAEGEIADVTFRLTRSGQGWIVTDVRTR